MKVPRPTMSARKLVAATVLALLPGLLAALPAPASAARAPRLAVGDSAHWETQSGTQYFVFTVRLSNPTGRPVTVSYATANGTAHAPTDYVARRGTLRFHGARVTRKVYVPVHGDATPEADETFLVRLSRAHGARLGDRTGVGAIRNDDQRVTVLRTGDGAGTVTSSPTGIACGTDCTQVYRRGTSLTLNAAADAGSTFAGWSGGGCAGTAPTCTVTISTATSRQVTAAFDSVAAPVRALTVLGSGTGAGSVVSAPGGISCGLDCAESYPDGTPVTLTAVPAAGSTFAGWSGGGCTGTATTCVVTMDAAKTVTATFALQTFTLAVVTAGSGTVTSAPTGISCGLDCTETYPAGTPVTLTAAPASGYVFAGWSGGGCTSTATTCVVTMDGVKSVTATFTLMTFTLTVTRSGTGSGTVTSLPGGISCGSTCVATYAYGTMVTLSAVPGPGSTFVSWSGGGCTGTLLTCMLTMDAAKTVNAEFSS